MSENGDKPITLDSIFDSESEAETEIMQELMSLENLDRKTDLTRPIIWSVLETVTRFVESKGLTESTKILDNFRDMSFRYLVSKNRKGRMEYVQAVEAFADEMKAKNKQDVPR